MGAMTLLVTRLLRRARRTCGRRRFGVRRVVVGAGRAACRQRGFVLGPGSTQSTLNTRSSVGTRPTSRLLWRRVRRGRSSRFGSLLLGRHVEEDGEGLVHAVTGRGSHNLAPPSW